MSRRRNRSRQVGFGAAFGAVTGFVTGWLVVLALGAGLFVLTAAFFRLWEATGSATAAFAGAVLLGVTPFVLWAWRQEVAWKVRLLLGGAPLVRLDEREVGRPFEGSVYTFWDSYGTRRYDGRSGNMRALLGRIDAHYDPQGGTALSGLIGPGWTWTVRTFHTYDEARQEEARLIGKHFGQPGYENKRLESAT